MFEIALVGFGAAFAGGILFVLRKGGERSTVDRRRPRPLVVGTGLIGFGIGLGGILMAVLAVDEMGLAAVALGAIVVAMGAGLIGQALQMR